MATGGEPNVNFGKSINLSSDEDFEFSCTRCTGKDKISEAKNYCPECHEYYCNICVEIHSEIATLKSHPIQGEDTKQNWGQGKTKGHVGPQCPHHEDQRISMFCGQHDALCCPVCVSLDHRLCQGMAYIPKIACGIFNSPDLLTLNDETESAVLGLELLVKNGNDKKRNLDLSHQSCKKQIRMFREKVDTIMNKLEEKALEDMYCRHEESEQAVVARSESCRDMIQKLQEQVKMLKDTDHTSETQMFIKLKQFQEFYRECKKAIDDLTSISITDNFTFSIDADLVHYVENIESLGAVDTPIPSESQAKANCQGLQTVYSMTTKEDINVKLYSDKYYCSIESICQVESGEIILTDSMNSNIKLMDRAYTIVDQLSLISYPYDVCSVGQNLVVAGLHNNSIQFVSLNNGKLKATKSVQLGHQCCRMAASESKLYISEYMGKKVYVYSSAYCKQLKILYKDRLKKRLFQQIQILRVSKDDRKLYVADSDKGIKILNREGNIMATISSDDLNDIGGMCVDLHGNLFVGSKSSSKVLQVVDNRSHVMVSQGVHNPVALWFDTLSLKLLVFNGVNQNSNIMVFNCNKCSI